MAPPGGAVIKFSVWGESVQYMAVYFASVFHLHFLKKLVVSLWVLPVLQKDPKKVPVSGFWKFLWLCSFLSFYVWDFFLSFDLQNFSFFYINNPFFWCTESSFWQIIFLFSLFWQSFLHIEWLFFFNTCRILFFLFTESFSLTLTKCWYWKLFP